MIRLRNPRDGVVTWDDLVKGPISISNHEIDDLVLVRADGVPTYNFSVVVDDWDMRISHVFRGDEHVNNTPWQINLYAALGAPQPLFGHVPIILGDDGLKLSKRRGAVSVIDYRDAGYLPEAMLNYLARLGWSHGDDELFGRAQLVEWFDGSHLAKSPAQWDVAKLNWVNAQAIKHTPDAELAGVDQRSHDRAWHLRTGRCAPGAMCALFKDRCATLVELADWLEMYHADLGPRDAAMEAVVAAVPAAALATLADASRAGRMGSGRDRRGDQGSSCRAWPEDGRTWLRPCGSWSAAGRRRPRSMRFSSSFRAKPSSPVCEVIAEPRYNRETRLKLRWLSRRRNREGV